MARVTMNKVREMAAKYGYEFYKGNGYFYFPPMEGTQGLMEEGEYGVWKLNHYTLEEWEQVLLRKLNQSRIDPNNTKIDTSDVFVIKLSKDRFKGE